PLHELVELLLRLGIHEPVVLELPDLSGGVRRKRIEELLADAGVVLGPERERAALGLEDLPEALLHFAQRSFEAELVLLPAALLAQSGSERVEARDSSPH